MHHLQALIEEAYENRAELSPQRVAAPLKAAIDETIAELDAGRLRVAEKREGQWQTEQWIKKAILLFFRIYENKSLEAGCLRFYDKVPLKFQDYSETDFAALGARIVPSAIVRKGAYLAANTVLMPSYVNLGAYIDSGTMV
ncbi:MAG TPA: 2,3,4,5-tetrahydropyridine-2,6-dicarboxylate N-succinyltransferase, partial [Gammaproteobacteria bacterium]|nr:2,3,4,5-tetrahydropyridine-2,6-dicarboxylate N-succinyltransferase [Gammaproteobacteria bacterium]